ncbi:hypothetical protein ACU5AY_05525 [Rhizobium sp. PAMB 3174]
MLRRILLLVALLAVPLGNVDKAKAAGESLSGNTHLPLKMNEFASFVRSLSHAAGGREAEMARKLEALGFTCSSSTPNRIFQCVKFGCRRRGGFLFAGSLLQWSVQKEKLSTTAPEYSGTVVNYSYSARCIPEDRLSEEQSRFLAGHGSTD